MDSSHKNRWKPMLRKCSRNVKILHTLEFFFADSFSSVNMWTFSKDSFLYCFIVVRRYCSQITIMLTKCMKLFITNSCFLQNYLKKLNNLKKFKILFTIFVMISFYIEWYVLPLHGSNNYLLKNESIISVWWISLRFLLNYGFCTLILIFSKLLPIHRLSVQFFLISLVQ